MDASIPISMEVSMCTWLYPYAVQAYDVDATIHIFDMVASMYLTKFNMDITMVFFLRLDVPITI